ncbi:MAG: BamA/TamA family outer membrane protein [Fibrobacter sp.]|nr:BamA/TamA family outer membrane protein [Fibrobacter sp.]MBR2306182.1 BamA/TamA family outer membrane protein [Fibrobacter sp.]MBR4008196.1 BamA/TamA family outer membrane protein [Fibrobacter sp.]
MVTNYVKTSALALLLASLGLAAQGTCTDGTVVHSIQLEGLKHTNPRVVERELVNREGEPFTAEKFEAEKLRLQDLDLFTEVSVSCEKAGEPAEPGLVKLTYSFKEIFRWIPAPAGKKTDRDGLMLGAALANINVAGEDIRLEVQYRTTVDPFFDKNEAAFYASSPYLFGLPLGWNFEFLLTDSYDNIRDFQEKSILLDLDLEYKFLPHLSLLGTAAYRRLRDFANLPELGLGFAFDYRDSKLDTRDGVYFEYMLTHVGAGEEYLACSANIESDEPVETESRFCNTDNGENYWELLTDARAYKTFGRFVTGATALVRYRPGDVKFYDYYYHGGANTFRGHEADSGSLGTHEALLTLEERFVLLERRAASVMGVNFFYGVQLVAGFDGSLLWDKGRPGWDNYEGAVYGGVHLVIPALDRIRFEVGYSPDRGEPVFYFGLFDKVTSSRWRSR